MLCRYGVLLRRASVWRACSGPSVLQKESFTQLLPIKLVAFKKSNLFQLVAFKNQTWFQSALSSTALGISLAPVGPKTCRARSVRGFGVACASSGTILSRMVAPLRVVGLSRPNARFGWRPFLTVGAGIFLRRVTLSLIIRMLAPLRVVRLSLPNARAGARRRVILSSECSRHCASSSGNPVSFRPNARATARRRVVFVRMPAPVRASSGNLVFLRLAPLRVVRYAFQNPSPEAVV